MNPKQRAATAMTAALERAGLPLEAICAIETYVEACLDELEDASDRKYTHQERYR